MNKYKLGGFDKTTHFNKADHEVNGGKGCLFGILTCVIFWIIVLAIIIF